MNLNRENMIRMMQLILFTVVVLAAALNYNRVLLLLARGIGLLFPFLLGAAVAFVLNVPCASWNGTSILRRTAGLSVSSAWS